MQYKSLPIEDIVRRLRDYKKLEVDNSFINYRLIKECFPDPEFRKRVLEHGRKVVKTMMKPVIANEEISKLADGWIELLREINKQSVPYVDLEKAEKSYPQIREAYINYLKDLYDITQRKLKADSF